MHAANPFGAQPHCSMIYLALVSHAVICMAIEKKQKVGNAILTIIIKYSIQLHTGVWISKSPDHDIIVMDVEGFSRKELEQEEVD
jgi:hypothetical protein